MEDLLKYIQFRKQTMKERLDFKFSFYYIVPGNILSHTIEMKYREEVRDWDIETLLNILEKIPRNEITRKVKTKLLSRSKERKKEYRLLSSTYYPY